MSSWPAAIMATLPEADHEPGREGVEEGDERGHRQEQQPGLQCCGAALLLEVEALEEDDAVKGCHRDHGDGQGGGDRSRAEQIKRDHRMPPPGLRRAGTPVS